MPGSDRLRLWVERSAWVLIYGGLLLLLCGVVLLRQDAEHAVPVMGAGTAAAVLGVLLIAWRARL